MESKSTCCDSSVKTNGDVTHYYTCDNCGEACDVKAYEILNNQTSAETIPQIIFMKELGAK